MDDGSNLRINYNKNCENLKVKSLYKNGKLLEKSSQDYKELKKFALMNTLLNRIEIQNKIFEKNLKESLEKHEVLYKKEKEIIFNN